MFGRIARECRGGGSGGDQDESAKEAPRSRRLAIKISEYETLNVEPYKKKKKKKGKGKMSSSSSRSPPSNSRSNSKRSAVFDYGNIYQEKDDLSEDYFLNSSVTGSSVCSSNQTISSYGSNPSLISGQSMNSNASQQLKQHEPPRFHSPIRTREQHQQLSSPPPGNPLEIKTRSKKDKMTSSSCEETREQCPR
jgi:hypothetical protein